MIVFPNPWDEYFPDPCFDALSHTVPRRSQGMILLSIIFLGSGERGGGSTGPASSGVVPKAASIWQANSSSKALKIAVRCVVIGSDGSPTGFAGDMAAPVIQFLQ